MALIGNLDNKSDHVGELISSPYRRGSTRFERRCVEQHIRDRRRGLGNEWPRIWRAKLPATGLPEGLILRILVTNDDGIHAPGLVALVGRLCDVGDVVAIAPDRPRSATGHAITLHKPLRMQEVSLPGDIVGYSTNGTPSDCVVLGMSSLDPKPQLVISGINQGPNLGEDLTYSGTVSAAMEAAICGVKAFAISIASFEISSFDVAADFAAYLADMIARQGLPPDTFLNVNVPDVEPSAIAGVAITRQGRRRYQSRVERRVDPRGRPYYWLGGDLYHEDIDTASDVGAIAADMISITPIHLDLTHHSFLKELRAWGIEDGWRCAH
jgi:5'-nucleotidase